MSVGAMQAVREAGPRPEAQPPPRLVGTPSEEAELLDLFERQRTPPSALPDPSASVFAIAQGVVDVLGGHRSLTQLNAWVDDEVRERLRTALALMPTRRPGCRRMRVTRLRITTPAPGVVEACAVVSGHPRSRALALRLEGLDGRWRATSIEVG